MKLISLKSKSYTVKSALRDHLLDKKISGLIRQVTSVRGLIHMKCSMTGQENVTFKYR